MGSKVGIFCSPAASFLTRGDEIRPSRGSACNTRSLTCQRTVRTRVILIPLAVALAATLAPVSAAQERPARLAAFERALERSVISTIRTIAAEVARDNARVMLRWEDPVADGLALPASADVVFLVKLPALFPDATAREPFPVARYSERVVDALIDAIVDRAPALGVPADGRLIVAALAAPEGPRPMRVARVYLMIKGEDLAALASGTIAAVEARRRVMLTHEPAVVSLR